MSPNERKLLADVLTYLVDGYGHDFQQDHYIDNTPDNLQLVQEMNIHQIGEECEIKYSADKSQILTNLHNLLDYVSYILSRE